jgi:ERCC4-type nuclease
MEGFSIIMSSRLRENPVARVLGELEADINFITLRQGEFLLGKGLGIKYLTGEKFAAMVRDRSIYREIAELKREFTEPTIIVEGGDPFHDSSISLAALQSALLFITIQNRVPILATQSEMETAQIVFLLAGQSGKSLMPPDMDMSAAELLDPAGGNGHGDPRLRIVAALPDVGPSRAKALLAHFGTLAKLFASGVDELKRVSGIGAKRAEKIHSFLTGQQLS